MKLTNAWEVGWLGQSSVALFLIVLVCAFYSTVKNTNQGANTARSSLEQINKEFCEGMRKRNSTIKSDICS